MRVTFGQKFSYCQLSPYCPESVVHFVMWQICPLQALIPAETLAPSGESREWLARTVLVKPLPVRARRKFLRKRRKCNDKLLLKSGNDELDTFKTTFICVVPFGLYGESQWLILNTSGFSIQILHSPNGAKEKG